MMYRSFVHLSQPRCLCAAAAALLITFTWASTAPASEPAPTAPAEKKPINDDKKPEAKSDAKTKSVLDLKLKDIDGKETDLSQYKGKVVIFVNVASECGYTRQYDGLQKLHEAYKDKGVVIIGLPCNDFGGQEPGTEADIKKFCTGTYNVKFPMMSKVAIKGTPSPIYAALISQPAPIGGDPKWNFTKFIVDRNGKVAARFEPRTEPMSKELTNKLDELLAQQPAAPATKADPEVPAPASDKAPTPSEKK